MHEIKKGNVAMEENEKESRYCPECRKYINTACWLTDFKKCNVCQTPWVEQVASPGAKKKVEKRG